MDNTDSALARDHGFFSLMGYAFPSIFTFVFIAAYQIVDGVFIEHFAGELAISAVNLYYPVVSLFIALGLMLGTGGNAIIVRLVGEGEREKADLAFSCCLIFTVVIGALITVFGLVFAEPVMRWLGASDVSIEFLRPYYLVLTASAVLILLQSTIGNLVIGEGKLVTAAVLTMIGGVLNCVLDYVFMKYLRMGIHGAAVATAIGYAVPIFYGVYYYFIGKKSVYRFRLCVPRPRVVWEMSFNGSSELVSNIASGVTVLIMNHLIYRYQRDAGISAFTVLQYIQVLITLIFMGFCTAVGPVFSYWYGAKDAGMCRKLLRLCVLWIAVLTVGMCAVLLFGQPLFIRCFFEPGGQIYAIADHGYLLFLGGAVFVGLNIFASSLYTAFSNGLVSGGLSFTRTFVILIAAMYALEALFGEEGVWAAWTAAEALSFLVSTAALLRLHRKLRAGRLEAV